MVKPTVVSQSPWNKSYAWLPISLFNKGWIWLKPYEWRYTQYFEAPGLLYEERRLIIQDE